MATKIYDWNMAVGNEDTQRFQLWDVDGKKVLIAECDSGGAQSTYYVKINKDGSEEELEFNEDGNLVDEFGTVAPWSDK